MVLHNTLNIWNIFRSSRLEVFCKKGVLGNFPKFTGKHHNFIKKETLAQVFSCEFWEIIKNPFSYRTLPVAASVYYCSYLAHFRSKWKTKKIFNKQNIKEENDKKENKLIFQITFLRYYFLQGTFINSFLIHNKRSVIEAFCLACKLQIWSYLQKKSLMENFIFCAVLYRGSKQKLEAFSESYFSEKGFHRKLAPIKTLKIPSKELSIIKSAGINSE